MGCTRRCLSCGIFLSSGTMFDFCSNKCTESGESHKREFNCIVCNKKCVVRKSNTKAKLCSHKCLGKYNKIQGVKRFAILHNSISPEEKKRIIKKRIKDNIKVVNGCFIWQGCVDKNGYGSFSVENKPSKVHREAYKAYHGEIKKGSFICHTCDNPSCCNPEHLYIRVAQSKLVKKINMNRNTIYKIRDKRIWKHVI